MHTPATPGRLPGALQLPVLPEDDQQQPQAVEDGDDVVGSC